MSYNENDKLEEMFDRCICFQKRLFGYDLPRKMSQRIPISITSIIAELGEILEENQGWKDWRKNCLPANDSYLKAEVADLWHFIINLTLYLGIDAKTLYKEFLKKNQKNNERQDNGY